MRKLSRKEDDGDASSSSNDIDVISIGTLYRGGRWEKKYWNSSRGKDRHPYPVGYQAARTYNGIASAMEIQQGNTGPLFVITSSDGQTSCGQTPNIAWKKFKRACSPRVKSLCGKRLSADIDGEEFFGFKYNIVQRLLRQMVAASTQSTRVSTTEQNQQIPNQSAVSAASDDLPKVCREGKGGEKRKIDHMELIVENKLMKVRPQIETNLMSSYYTKRDGDICDHLNNRSSTAATDNFAKPCLIGRQTMEDEKFCASLAVDMLNDSTLDPPLTLPKEKLSYSHESDDAPPAEGSPTRLSQEEETCMSDPNINFQNDDCDSVGEEITMSMMKLLLPQAVPLLKKARRTTNKTTSRFQRFSSARNIPYRDHAKDCSTADANSVEGERSNAISHDPSETKRAFESFKDIVPDSFGTEFNEHTILEQLPDVPDSCVEPDDNACVPDSCDELDNNVYVPDSCDELDGNAYAPESCDELDKNTHVLVSCDGIDENTYVPDSCDELDDEETTQDSLKEFNENHYVPDSCDKLADYCDKSDENKNIPVSTGLLADLDEKKVTKDCHVHACEGKEVPCTPYREKNLSAESMVRNEAINETSNLEIYPKESRCGTRFSEYEDSSNDNLKLGGRFNLASQLQNTNQTGHTGIVNVSSAEFNGGTCPVFINGCQSSLDKSVLLSDLKACAPNHNLYEKVFTCYEAGCSGKFEGHCREATIISADIPHSSVDVENKTPTCASYEDFVGIQKPPGLDMVNKGELMMSCKNASSMSETLHLKQSVFVDDSNVSASRRALDGYYSKLSIDTEREKKLCRFGKLIEFPGSDVVTYEELLRGEKNVNPKPQTLHHMQAASVDDSTMYAGQRAFDGHYSKLSMATEHENKLRGFGKLIELPGSNMINNEVFVMSEKNLSSKINTLHHEQSGSVDDSYKSFGHKAFDGYNSVINNTTEHENKLSGFGKLVGLYAHPKPVLSVLICSKENETYICTSCGTSQDNQRTLFLYKLTIEGTSAGRPYFVGHSPMLLPDPKCFFGRQIALDKSGMQFTPNGRNLVLLNGMQVPSCRNGLVQCQCLECESHSSEENGVKIVQLMHGYVTVLAKLKTVGRVLCLLVCEPNYLVAVEANGAFRIWSMNATWRNVTEEFALPPTDCISPCAIELKQIPKSPHLVVGHNCLGEFGLWDISRHTLISRFFIPDIAIFQFVPVSLYHRTRTDNTFTCLNSKEQCNSFENTTKLWSSQHTTSTMLKSNEKDIAIPILVATCPDIKSSYRPMPDGCWKLGLLMNHKVFLNHTLDARAVTVTASGDCGVLGTSQGYLHVWDLSTGLKRGTSLCFKDGRVQCLYTDTTRSGLLAVTDDKGKLLLYVGSQESQTLQTASL